MSADIKFSEKSKVEGAVLADHELSNDFNIDAEPLDTLSQEKLYDLLATEFNLTQEQLANLQQMKTTSLKDYLKNLA